MLNLNNKKDISNYSRINAVVDINSFLILQIYFISTNVHICIFEKRSRNVYEILKFHLILFSNFISELKKFSINF